MLRFEVWEYGSMEVWVRGTRSRAHTPTRPHPHTPILPYLCAAALLALPAGAAAEPIRVELNAAAPAEVARTLTRVLNVPVEVRGGAGRQWTLTASAETPTGIVERV